MTNLKCPFCQQKLDTGRYYVHCHNPHCNTTVEMEGTEEMWLALIRTRKALELAIERLEQIAHESFQGDQQSINMGFHIRAAAALTDIEQITALE